MKCFYIIGGGINGFTKEAEEALRQCGDVISSLKCIELYCDINRPVNVVSYDMAADTAISSECSKIAIIVSGDAGFYSVSSKLKFELEKHGYVKVICGINSMQYFASKLGLSYDNWHAISVHGRPFNILGAVSYNRYVFVLTDTKNSPQKIFKSLKYAGLGHLKVYVGNMLGTKNEKITLGGASEMAEKVFLPPSVVLIENNYYCKNMLPVKDSDIIRGEKIPMTKEEVRWIAVNKLGITPNDIVYDIGGGTGSVSIEMAKKAFNSIVYSIDDNENAIGLIKKNIAKSGCYNVITVKGKAPEIFCEIPKCDCAFIGGTKGHMYDIIKYLKNINESIRVVITAVTIENTAKAIECLKSLKFKNIDTITVNISRGESIGNVTIQKAMNPITVIYGDMI